MQLALGSITFPVNGTTVAAVTTPVVAGGRVVRYTTRYSVQGCLEADGQAALTVAENQLRGAIEAANTQNATGGGVDLVLRQDSGAPSGLNLVNAASVSGVRVVSGPIFSNQYGGAEYATARSFAFECEAEFIPAGMAGAILEWAETVSVTGTGGPEYSWRRPVNAPPIRQMVRPYTTITATQAGRAVGQTDYPIPPPPLFPAYEMVHLRKPFDRSTPTRLGKGFVEYACAWAYVFEADVQLIGLPSLPTA